LRGALWSIRLLLLVVVSGIVLSPLAVSGAASSPQPVGWNHDPSALTLPSSPIYPGVIVYRDIRMSLADHSFERAELLLGFSNDDAAAISTMARRQEYVVAAAHGSAYLDTFSRSVAWLLVASERGNNVSYLLSRLKNDHMAQQSALGEAAELLPEWSSVGLASIRVQAVAILLDATQTLEDGDAARSYKRALVAMHPELSNLLQEAQHGDQLVDPSLSALIIPDTGPVEDSSADQTSEVEILSDPPSLAALHAEQNPVLPGDTISITAMLGSGESEDLRYSWWCSRGRLVADSTHATWTAPDIDGVCEINLTVTDARGRRDIRGVEIWVLDDLEGSVEGDSPSNQEEPATDQPIRPVYPEILSLTATADHKFLNQNLGGGYAILVSREAELRCEVVDAAGLTFEWIVEGDCEITGSGHTVMMKAPARSGYFTVTVTVSNSDGEQDSHSLTFYASTCTICF